MVGVARGDEEIVGEPVDIGERGLPDPFAFARSERDDAAFGAPANGARLMQGGGGWRAARQDEGA